ncbi:MAG: FGGY-family carbohydrate kinase [Roseobacter sp.]
MKQMRHIAVIDIGKTNAKLALVDLDKMAEVDVVTRPNTVRAGPPWPHFDTKGHWAFLQKSLAQFHDTYGIDGISVTTHGASIVLLDNKGELAAPILDYEFGGPEETTAEYDVLRPQFCDTGSPRLANGLNVGAQLHWQFKTDSRLHARTAHILTYPQYWGYLLTGEMACDVTSIGCHTDLWMPHQGAFSHLVTSLDIADKIAPVLPSGETLGTILPKVATATGLPVDTPVTCGIHDSNASLYSHIATQTAPFSVVSTGTWVIAMALGGQVGSLDPRRDTLINVNALGAPVPSARFMGGREYDLIQQGHPVNVAPEDVERVLLKKTMLLPSVDPMSGPFQGRAMRWTPEEPIDGSGERTVALSFYLALMTFTCLDLAGARGNIIVEGPFSTNIQYLDMLHAMTGRSVFCSESATGTSIGAALLFGLPKNVPSPKRAQAPAYGTRYKAYGEMWLEML